MKYRKFNRALEPCKLAKPLSLA